MTESASKESTQNDANPPAMNTMDGCSSSSSTSQTNDTIGNNKVGGDGGGGMMFGQFHISANQIFYHSPTKLTAGIVNLRPIVPGHVLLIPNRIVPRLFDLTPEEYQDLWSSVRTVQTMLQHHYKAGGFNISVQDGKVAGQSVSHVHVHILPRHAKDFVRNDDVYDKLEEWAPTDKLGESKLKGLDVPDDEERKDRTLEQMAEEARFYRLLLEQEGMQ